MIRDKTDSGPAAPSAARVAANQANAKKSTGPRTPAGKARSALNATTHGAYAHHTHAITHGLLREDQDQVEGFVAAVVADLDPRNTLEATYATKIARLALAENRRDHYETQLLDQASQLDGTDLYTLGGDPEQLNREIAVLGTMADWGRHHFADNIASHHGQDPMPDPVAHRPYLYKEMVLALQMRLEPELSLPGIWEDNYEPSGADTWQSVLATIVEDRLPDLDQFLAWVDEATTRTTNYRRQLINQATPIVAERSLTVLERTLTSSTRISSELHRTTQVYNWMRAQPAPDDVEEPIQTDEQG